MKKVLLLAFIIALFLPAQIALAAELTVSADKTEYVKGATVSISSTLAPAENETLTGAAITIRVEQAGGLIAESSSNGASASYSWVSDRTGTIDIKANASWENKTANAQTAVSVKAKALSAALTGIKDQYYPAENSEARVTVTDESGKVVTDASVTAYLVRNGANVKSIFFSYSTLCDCYKGWVWIEEGYLGTYTLNASVKKSGYDAVRAAKSFEVAKPSLELSISTDKTSYHPDEKIKITITAKDKSGNPVSPYLSGEIRDENGFLVENIYPWKDGDVYIEDRYVPLSDVGKSYIITVKGDWKEQKDNKTVTVYITKIGLMAEVFIDKTTINTGDYLTGKIEVKDNEGNLVKDAWVDARLYGPNEMNSIYLSTDYKDGFYVLEKKKIEEWQMAGEYTLKVKVEKAGDKKEIEKVIKIEKNKLGINIEFDKLVYKPGDKIYLKILVTDPQGNVLKDAWVSGEIFPLTTETRKPEGWPEAPQICRMYLSPEGPIYYQAQFIQKYFVDEVYINDWCPVDKYVLRLKVGKSGYDDVEIEKEFEVVLLKILMETGTKIISEQSSARINIYAEVKDEIGNMLRDVKVNGYLHPTEEQGCIKRADLYFDDITKKHMTTMYIDKKECPAGKYNLELSASHSSYSPVSTTNIIEIKYEEGYEYRELTPIVVPEPVCEVVSCGPGCFQKVCGATESPCTISIDKACITKCKELKGEDIGSCVKGCERQECASAGSSEQEMMKKLEEIHSDIRETKKDVAETKQDVVETRKGVNLIDQMIRSIWDFLSTFFGLPPLPEPVEPGVAPEPTQPILGIPENCVSWFDGCNKCDVVNGEIDVCTDLACAEYEEPKCLLYKTKQEVPKISEPVPTAKLVGKFL